LETIDLLVERYQQGEQDSALELVNQFSSLINKFVKFLKGGEVDFENSAVSKFISLVIEDADLRKKLMQNTLSEYEKQKIRKIVSFISFCMRTVEKEDIKQELIAIFLKMARRYKPKGRSFTTYLSSSFHYEVYRFVMRYVPNPLSYADTFEEYLSPSYSEDWGDEQEYGVNWVNGSEAEHPFDTLKPVDRIILVKRFIEKKTIRQIAREMGYSETQIRKRIKKAKWILWEQLSNFGAKTS